MKVGIFDSGVGGITVLKTALKLLPQVDYIYYSDNNHVPYGTKTKEEVLGYVNDVVAFLISQQVDAIVIACNTATSIAVKTLRSRYPVPIIGMEPAVKLAFNHHSDGKVLVTATSLTLKEEKFKNLVNRLGEEERVCTLALPELVTFAEAFMFEEAQIKAYFKEKLKDYPLEEIVAIVLGCTHFVYFKKILKECLPPHITVYDGNEGTIRHLKELIDSEKVMHIRKEPEVTFYYSGKRCESKELLNKYLDIIEV